MSNIPENLLYSNTHEWLRVEDGIGTIGITDHAQNELTEIVFVELPEVGRQLAVNDACAVVESVKSASDIHAPAAGEVTEVNTALVDVPELVNDNPYVEGWFIKIKLAGESEGLLDAGQYAAEIGEA
jgi:glycine cleavage system H protein